jgi:hypothetical protein
MISITYIGLGTVLVEGKTVGETIEAGNVSSQVCPKSDDEMRLFFFFYYLPFSRFVLKGDRNRETEYTVYQKRSIPEMARELE